MKSKWVNEMICFCTALLFAATLSYFFYLKPTLHLATITDKQYHQFNFNLLQLQQDQQSDSIISQKLSLLKQKDLSGYQIISQSDGNTGLLLIIFCCVLSKNIFADNVIPHRNPFLPINNITVGQSSKMTNQTPLQSAWIPVYFSNSDNIMGFLSDKSLMLLSPVGKMHYDKRTNQLWIQDDARHIAQIRSLISHLDQDGPQFLIKARIVT